MPGNGSRNSRVRLYSPKLTNYTTEAVLTRLRPYFVFTQNPVKNDYNNMRIIDDQTFAEIIKMLTDDPKVKLFQKLVLSPKAEPGDKPDEIKTDSEVKENGIQ